jgi:hypothetical protein
MSGRKRGLGSMVPRPSMQKYRCNAAGCAITPRGCDLPTHYKTKSNWDTVRELRAAMGTSALEKQLEAADPHTRFCFQQGYTEKKLPRWESHVSVKVVSGREEGEGASTAPKQSKLTDLFQVKKQFIILIFIFMFQLKCDQNR